MSGRDVAELFGLAIVGLLLVSMLAGSFLGQPVVLGYVETESMSPTLEPGDGFVAVPAPLMGPVEAGDVVVFEAEVIDGGGLTTHRVVGETESGFVTRGDNNVVTDQDSGEPPVGRDRIVAEALQIGGHVVVVPGVGVIAGAARSLLAGVQAGVSGVVSGQSVAYLLFGAGVLAYLWSEYAERQNTAGPERRDRSRTDESVDSRVALVGIALLMGVVLSGSMVLADSTHEFDVISADQDSERQYVIEKGMKENVTYTVPSYGLLPAAVFLEPESENVAVEPQELYVPSRASRNATVTLTAPPTIGHHPQRLTEHRYLGVLPMGLTRWLYNHHPILPVVAINLLVGVGVIGMGWALFGNRRIRLDSRTPERTLRYRLKRWLR